MLKGSHINLHTCWCHYGSMLQYNIKKSNKANSSHTNIFNDKEMLNRIKLSHNKELNAKIAYHWHIVLIVKIRVESVKRHNIN